MRSCFALKVIRTTAVTPTAESMKAANTMAFRTGGGAAGLRQQLLLDLLVETQNFESARKKKKLDKSQETSQARRFMGKDI